MPTKGFIQYCSQDKQEHKLVKLKFEYGVTEGDVVSSQVRCRENSLRLMSLPGVPVHLKVFTTAGDCMLLGWATSDPCKQVHTYRDMLHHPPRIKYRSSIPQSSCHDVFYSEIKLRLSNFRWNYNTLIGTIAQIYFLFRIISNQVTPIGEPQKQHFSGALLDWCRHGSCYGFVWSLFWMVGFHAVTM